MAFLDKFKDQRWTDRKATELERAGEACESCESVTDLDVIVPFLSADRDPWAYPDGSYRVLCRQCSSSHRTLERDLKFHLSQLVTTELESLGNALALLLDIPRERRAGSVERLYAAARREHEEQARMAERPY